MDATKGKKGELMLSTGTQDLINDAVKSGSMIAVDIAVDHWMRESGLLSSTNLPRLIEGQERGK